MSSSARSEIKKAVGGIMGRRMGTRTGRNGVNTERIREVEEFCGTGQDASMTRMTVVDFEFALLSVCNATDRSDPNHE